MAEMHPSMPFKGTLSAGEHKVFFALQEGLPATYTVLHSVSLLVRPKHGGPLLLDREIDFVVCHPAYGLLAIEVKGGGIRCDARNQCWTSISAVGQEHEIKNPYDQCRPNVYSLLDELAASKLTNRYSYPAGFAVWFPDLELASSALGQCGGHRDVTLDAMALQKPECELRRIFRECLIIRATAEPPGPGGVEALVRQFMPKWEAAVRWRTTLSEEEETLLHLTRSQHKVLSMLGRKKRALICGTAGSGKTFLAVEKARRLAAEGSAVLLVCYNLRLAEWLRNITKDVAGVTVFSFHALCYHLCALAGHPKPRPDPHGDRDYFFRYELPEAMLEAVESVRLRFDALLVDEAQDFEAVWWIGLESLLRDPVAGLLYLFYDDNQHIYGTRLEFPIDEPPLMLCENCRNTQTIFAGFMEHYLGESAPDPVGPEGRPIEIIEAADDVAEQRAIERVLRRLLTEEGIPPSAITLLSGRAQEKSMWTDGMPVVRNIKLSWASGSLSNTIACSTIHSFKGLENSIVIVTEMAHTPKKVLRELLYVAFSRAKFHLVICGPKPIPIAI